MDSDRAERLPVFYELKDDLLLALSSSSFSTISSKILCVFTKMRVMDSSRMYALNKNSFICSENSSVVSSMTILRRLNMGMLGTNCSFPSLKVLSAHLGRAVRLWVRFRSSYSINLEFSRTSFIRD
jgi:hypothetical protein